MSKNGPPAFALPGGSSGANPHLPTSVAKVGTVRAQSPGGELLGYLQSTDLEYFERVWRVLPQPGMAQATPSKPTTFTMGSERAPKSQVLVILDYAFNVYRFSGAAAGDYVPFEPNSLSTQVMWDISVNGKRERLNVQYQVIPQQPTQTNQAFANSNVLARPQAWQFDIARAAQQQAPGGFGLAGMPQRRHREGLVKVSNQYVARASETLVVQCSVINPIPRPVAFFEAEVFGLLIPQNVYDAYQAANVPTGNPQVPVMIDQTSGNGDQ